jgi:hypothetical protein
MFTNLIEILFIASLGGIIALRFSSPQKFKLAFFYFLSMNFVLLFIMLTWNFAVEASLSALNEVQSGQSEFNADILSKIKIEHPLYWLPSLIIFVVLILLYYLPQRKSKN